MLIIKQLTQARERTDLKFQASSREQSGLSAEQINEIGKSLVGAHLQQQHQKTEKPN